MANKRGKGRPERLFGKPLVPPMVVVVILVAVLSLMFALVTQMAIAVSREAALLDKKGAESQAIVIDRKSKRLEVNRTRYTVTLVFDTTTGQTITVIEDVGLEAFQTMTLGAIVPLRYAVSNPKVVELAHGAAWRSARLAWIAAAVLGLGVGLSLWLGRAVMRQKQAEEPEG